MQALLKPPSIVAFEQKRHENSTIESSDFGRFKECGKPMKAANRLQTFR